MSKPELKQYAKSFEEAVPARVVALSKAVKGTAGFEGWEPDLTPESLERLGEWLEKCVSVRRRTPKEMEALRASLTFPVDVPEDELTDETFAIAMDAGMYFARVILANFPGTRWGQEAKSKNYMHYGQPLIVGLGMGDLNPPWVLTMVAYRVSRGERAHLRALFDTWTKKKQA